MYGVNTIYPMLILTIKIHKLYKPFSVAITSIYYDLQDLDCEKKLSYLPLPFTFIAYHVISYLKTFI
jgi:hypothetical protein